MSTIALTVNSISGTNPHFLTKNTMDDKAMAGLRSFSDEIKATLEKERFVSGASVSEIKGKPFLSIYFSDDSTETINGKKWTFAVDLITHYLN